jgi:sugar lactone lactonase YvrE
MSTLGRFPTGSLFRLDKAGLARIFDAVTVPNCLAWVPSNNSFLFTDSVLKVVWNCRYDPASGSVLERSVFVDCSDYRGIPDGCAFDDDGCVWIAEFGGGCVRRYDPAGRVVSIVKLPATQVTTCCFAGPLLDKLVIVTSKRLLDEEQRKLQPEAGNLFVCEGVGRGAGVALADSDIVLSADTQNTIHKP